jgi:hypothetical protein
MKPGDVLPARWYEESLEPLSPDARVVAGFDPNRPAAVMSHYGKGKTLMLGSFVSAAYQSMPSPATERFYAALLDWAGVVRTVEAGPKPCCSPSIMRKPQSKPPSRFGTGSAAYPPKTSPAGKPLSP